MSSQDLNKICFELFVDLHLGKTDLKPVKKLLSDGIASDLIALNHLLTVSAVVDDSEFFEEILKKIHDIKNVLRLSIYEMCRHETNFLKYIKILFDHGLDPYFEVDRNKYLFERFYEMNNVECVEEFLKRGVVIRKNTIRDSISNEKFEMLALFAKYTPRINLIIDESSIIFYLCRDNKISMLEKILELGANPSLPLYMGKTPLSIAAETKSLETVKILLKHGASVQNIHSCSDFPLFYAHKFGHVEIIEALMNSIKKEHHHIIELAIINENWMLMNFFCIDNVLVKKSDLLSLTNNEEIKSIIEEMIFE